MDSLSKVELVKLILLSLLETDERNPWPSEMLAGTVLSQGVKVHDYHELISDLVGADLIRDTKNGLVWITLEGLIRLERLLKQPEGTTPMPTPKDETTPAKKTVKFGPKKRARLLAKAIKRFPEQFMLKDKALLKKLELKPDTVFVINDPLCTVSKKDGEITLALSTNTDKEGEVVHTFTPKALKMGLRKIPKPKREGNISRMIRLLGEGKSMKEIRADYTTTYVAEGKDAEKDAKWIKGRVTIYANIAAKQNKEAGIALKKLRDKAKKLKAKKAEEAKAAEPAPKKGKSKKKK